MPFEIARLSDLYLLCDWTTTTLMEPLSEARPVKSTNGLKLKLHTIKATLEPKPKLRAGFAAIDAKKKSDFGTEDGIDSRQLTMGAVRKNLGQLPDEAIYPPFTATGLTAAPNDFSGRYVKRTVWLIYLGAKGTTHIAIYMLHEAKEMEHLLQQPHQDIASYYGCLVKRCRIAGLVPNSFHSLIAW
ncbi:hypothetical protein V8C42DRAFT_337903 [Trichoderma barbatum]